MTPDDIWQNLDLKLIAVLRGITPDETAGVVGALLTEGFRAIEVTMNSPEPLKSIEIALEVAAPFQPCLIGAGTVLSPEEVDQVHALGANLIVSPDMNADVVARTRHHGMASFPGVFSASEAHAAVRMGATGLKFFPAFALGSAGIKAINATLPAHASLCAVGGISGPEFAEYAAVGVEGFGLGTNLYKAGKPAADVQASAREIVSQFKGIRG